MNGAGALARRLNQRNSNKQNLIKLTAQAAYNCNNYVIVRLSPRALMQMRHFYIHSYILICVTQYNRLYKPAHFFFFF